VTCLHDVFVILDHGTGGQRLLTVGDAARVLRCSRGSVYRYTRTGALVASRIGESGQLRYRAEDVEALLRPARPKATA
jgi:excisionase family DNA binding protein